MESMLLGVSTGASAIRNSQELHRKSAGKAQANLELIKVDAALNDGLRSPASLHEGDDERGREEVQPLVGGFDPEGGTAHKGQHTEPAVPVQQLAWPRCCDDVCDGLGEKHAPCTCAHCGLQGSTQHCKSCDSLSQGNSKTCSHMKLQMCTNSLGVGTPHSPVCNVTCSALNTETSMIWTMKSSCTHQFHYKCGLLKG